MADTKAAPIRAGLAHPVVDLDGHWLEPRPVFLEFLRDIGGQKLTEEWLGSSFRNNGWYDLTDEERFAQRVNRPSWWVTPSTTLDYATGAIPGLMYERLPDLGIDMTILYPSLGLFLAGQQREDLRRTTLRAYNTMQAELFRPYKDRIIPTAVIPNRTPEEAIHELRYAVRDLGYKAVVMGGIVNRQARAGANGAPPKMYADALGLDNAYDYDPVWQEHINLGVAATTHGGTLGGFDRNSPTSMVFNHVGHFAQAHHIYARALFLGGVVRRFPTLNFAFLEGGVGWAATLMEDLVGHWEKRNYESAKKYLRPSNLDQGQLRELIKRYGTESMRAHLDELIGGSGQPGHPLGPQRLTDREIAHVDDFAASGVAGPEDVLEMFSRNFYFGCEADDPLTMWAFDPRMGARLKASFSSDISHWDVHVMEDVLPEAYELVEKRYITDDDFKDFAFANAVRLHARLNPDFFTGTVVERQAAAVLASERSPVGVRSG